MVLHRLLLLRLTSATVFIWLLRTNLLPFLCFRLFFFFFFAVSEYSFRENVPPKTQYCRNIFSAIFVVM